MSHLVLDRLDSILKEYEKTVLHIAFTLHTNPYSLLVSISEPSPLSI